MSGVALAVLERPHEARRVLAAAAQLADLSAALRINVLAIRLPPFETITAEDILSFREEARIRAEEQRRVDALQAVFADWSRQARPSNTAAEWFDIEGRADQIVAEWGRRSDVLVLKRPVAHPSDPERQAIHAALFATDRPVLVVPPEAPAGGFGRRVAIAWRDDPRTLKAVLAALRWLRDAERIFVLAGARQGEPAPALPDVVEEHGVAAELHLLPVGGQREFGEVLLAKTHELGADLMVMGAFARHPLRSLILGGVTRHMLAHADLPVFMRH